MKIFYGEKDSAAVKHLRNTVLPNTNTIHKQNSSVCDYEDLLQWPSLITVESSFGVIHCLDKK